MPTTSASLSGDYATQLAMLQQRQKMAQMLQEQAVAPIEVQSYNGIQAPISNLSILAKALQGFGGAYLSGQALKDAGALQKQAKDQYTTALSMPDTVSVVPKLTAQSLQSFMSPTTPTSAPIAAPAPVPSAPPPMPSAPVAFSSDISGAPQGNPRLAAALEAPVPPTAAPEAAPVAAPAAPPMPQPFVPGPLSEAVPQRPMTGQERLQRGAQMIASGNPMLAAYAPEYMKDAHNQIKSEAALAGLNTKNLPENVKSQLSSAVASGMPPEKIVEIYNNATKPMRVGDTVQQFNPDTGKMDVIADARTKWEQVPMDSLSAEQRKSIPPGMVVLTSNNGDMKTVNASDAQSIKRIQDDIDKSRAEGAPALAVSNANLALSKDRFAYEKEQNQAAVLSPDVIKNMAAQAWQGDKSVFQNLGRGKQGAQNLANLRTEIVAQGQGRPPGDLARMNANFIALTAEARAIGSRSGAATFANAEMPQAVQLSKESYAKLPRGQFVPFNELQRLVANNTSNTEQGVAYVNDEDAISAYARALSPNGIARKSDIEKGEKILSGATSIESHNAKLDAMQIVVEKRQAAGHGLLAPQVRKPSTHDPALMSAADAALAKLGIPSNGSSR